MEREGVEKTGGKGLKNGVPRDRMRGGNVESPRKDGMTGRPGES